MESTSLKCRKCRKNVLDSASLLVKNSLDDSDAAFCSIWHVSVDALPDWMKKQIEEAQWTIGKLKCQHCGARLGGFNFACSSKCFCGQDRIVHVCKRRVDYDEKVLLPILNPSEKRTVLKENTLQDPQSLDNGIKVRPQRLNRNMFTHAVGFNNEIREMTEPLCLEERSCNRDFKGPNLPAFSVDSWLASTKYAVRATHRKTHSLDYINRDDYDCSSDGSFKTSFHGSSLSNLLVKTSQPYSQKATLTEVSTTGSLDAYANRSNSVTVSETDRLLSQMNVDVGDACSITVHPSRHFAEHAVNVTRQLPSECNTEDELEVEHITSSESLGLAAPSTSLAAEKKLSKREKNKQKSIRRKQRRRERWILDQKKISCGNLPNLYDDISVSDKEQYMCAICLDIYFSPYMCYPCQHIFCEPCLRTLAKDNRTKAPCPLCRKIISDVLFQSELNHAAETRFPKEYLLRKQSFQRKNYSKWPLPSSGKFFNFFRGFRRYANPVSRRLFPRGGYRLNTMEADSRGWQFDIDMTIICLYSVNGILVFIIICYLCYIVIYC
ncbi:E3 ubiquitin-protein ligase RNF180-like [Erpetoichthys calabaricus]|uniref:E3 ubiquitin-protein ligase RNF180-like n=1 Tax=Erpetoichthys calabaricus TaxID=27687 RepID=UPI0022340C95|nr:E3 ubiquitin-protein ligase RNF180-like [Erpetoichthys calabaricus]